MSAPFTKPQPVLNTELLRSGAKSATAPRIMGVWLAANLVVTTLLTDSLLGLPAVGAWALGSLTAWVFAYRWESPLGATLTSFLVTSVIYCVLASLAKPARE